MDPFGIFPATRFAVQTAMALGTKACFMNAYFSFALFMAPFELSSMMLTTRAQRAIKLVERSPFGGHDVVHAAFGRG